LWSKDDITDRVLNTKAYQELGGVTGALQQQANKIYDKFDETQRKLAEEIFLELIELVGKEAVSRRADKGIFERDERQREVLYQLIDNRLLVSKGEEGKATVEVAHEELIRSWKVLQDLIREKEEIIVLRNRLYADAKQWDEVRQQDVGKANSELWSGSKLARIVEFKKEQALPNLDGVTIAFIAASVEERDRLQKAEIERQKRARKTAQMIAAGSVVAVVISGSLGAFAFIQYQIANQQTQVAVQQSRIALARQLATQAEFNKDKGNLQEFSNLDESSQNFTLKLGLESFPPRVVSLLKGIEPRILRFSLDKKLLAVTDDKFLYFFHIDSGKETKISESTIIYAMNFSPDGKALATAGADGTLNLWNVETGQKIRTFKGHQNSLTATAFSPDGKLLVTASFDKTIKLWNLEAGQEIRTLIGHTDIINSAVFSPDGKYILTTSFDKTAKIWDNNGREISTLLHDRPVRLAVFTAGGNIATVSGDTVVRIFNFKCQFHPRRQDLAEWQC
jgi:hypothetical protein